MITFTELIRYTPSIYVPPADPPDNMYDFEFWLDSLDADYDEDEDEDGD